MKNTLKVGRVTRSLAVVAAVTAGLSLAACSSDDSGDSGTTGTSSAPATQVAALPTAAELNAIINRAVDPAVPSDQKADTVQGGDQALELFDVMTQSKTDTGATVEVVDPVLPGILPDTVNATVNFLSPGQNPMPVSGVEFVKDNGVWKLTREWACTLVQNVAPDKVPPLCSADATAGALPSDVPAPAETPAGDAPAADTPAPVEGAPADGAPAEAPAPTADETPAA